MAKKYLEPEVYRSAEYNIVIRAKSAKTLMDIDGILTACDDIVTEAETQFDSISKNLGNVQLDGEALSVGDKTMGPLIEEISKFIIGLAEEGIAPTTGEIKEAAIEAYNKLQREYNNQAYDTFEAEKSAARALAQQNKNG